MKLDVKAESKVNEIIETIREFNPEPIRDEPELQVQLYQYLKAKFPELSVQREAVLSEALRVDLKVGPCGIELKVPKSRAHLQKLMRQVKDYSEYLDCMITVILNTGMVKDLSTFTSRLSSMGIIPIIIRGKLRPSSSSKFKEAKRVSLKNRIKVKQRRAKSKKRSMGRKRRKR